MENEVKNESKTEKPTTSEKSGGNKTLWIVIAVIVLVLIIAGAVSRSMKSRYSWGGVTVDEKNNSVTVSDDEGNTMSTGTNAKWPSDLSGDVPRYSGGEVYGSSKTATSDGTIWTITIRNTSESDFTAYKAALENSGWSSSSTTDFMVSFADYIKGEDRVNVTWDPSSSGVLISITK